MTGSLAYRGWHTAPLALPLPMPELQKRMASRRCNGCGTTHSRYWRSDLEEPNGWLCNNCGMNQRRGRGISRIGSSSSLDSVTPQAQLAAAAEAASTAGTTDIDPSSATTAAPVHIQLHAHARHCLPSPFISSHMSNLSLKAIAPSAEPCENVMDIGLLCQSPAKSIGATAVSSSYTSQSPGLLALASALSSPMMRIHSSDGVYMKNNIVSATTSSINTSINPSVPSMSTHLPMSMSSSAPNAFSGIHIGDNGNKASAMHGAGISTSTMVAHPVGLNAIYGNYSGYGALKNASASAGGDILMLSPTASLQSLADASDAAATAAAAAAAEATFSVSPAHSAPIPSHQHNQYHQQYQQPYHYRVQPDHMAHYPAQPFHPFAHDQYYPSHHQQMQYERQRQQLMLLQQRKANQQAQVGQQQVDAGTDHDQYMQISREDEQPSMMSVDPQDEHAAHTEVIVASGVSLPLTSVVADDDATATAVESQAAPTAAGSVADISPPPLLTPTASVTTGVAIANAAEAMVPSTATMASTISGSDTDPNAIVALPSNAVSIPVTPGTLFSRLNSISMQHVESMPADTMMGGHHADVPLTEMSEQPAESAPVTPPPSQHYHHHADHMVINPTLLLANAAAAAADADAAAIANSTGADTMNDASLKSKSHTRRPPVPTYVDPSKRKCGNCGTTRSAGKWRRDRERPDSYLCNKCGMNQRRAQMRLELQQQREAAASASANTPASTHANAASHDHRAPPAAERSDIMSSGMAAIAAAVEAAVNSDLHTSSTVTTAAAAAAEAAASAGFPSPGPACMLEHSSSYASSLGAGIDPQGSVLTPVTMTTPITASAVAAAALLRTPRQTRSATRPKSASTPSAMRSSPNYTNSSNTNMTSSSLDYGNSNGSVSHKASGVRNGGNNSKNSRPHSAEDTTRRSSGSSGSLQASSGRSSSQASSQAQSRSTVSAAVARARARARATSTSPTKRIISAINAIKAATATAAPTTQLHYPCNICNECIPTLEIDHCHHRICSECIPVILRNALKLSFIDCPVCVAAARRGQYQVYHMYHHQQQQMYPYLGGSTMGLMMHGGVGGGVMAIGQPTPIPVSRLGNFVDSMY